MLLLNFAGHCLPAVHFDAERGLPLDSGGGLCIAAVQAGICALQTPEGTLYAGAGDLLLWALPPAPQPQPGCEAFGLVMAGRTAEEMACGLEGPVLLRPAACPEAAQMLQNLYSGEKKLGPAAASALGYALLCRLASAGQEKEAAASPLVEAALEAIHTHYAEVYGVQELAQGLAVSKSHLIRRFTAVVGQPPGQYLTAVRVAHVKRLLLMDEFSLESIASLCGFSGANYLSKVFKREVGEAPGEWRRRAAGTAPPLRTENETRAYL